MLPLSLTSIYVSSNETVRYLEKAFYPIYVYLVLLQLSTGFTQYNNTNDMSQKVLRFPVVFWQLRSAYLQITNKIEGEITEMLCPKMLTSIKLDLKFCSVYFYTSEENHQKCYDSSNCPMLSATKTPRKSTLFDWSKLAEA